MTKRHTPKKMAPRTIRLMRCISSRVGCTSGVALTPGRVYPVIGSKGRRFRLIDDAGNTCVCPAACFAPTRSGPEIIPLTREQSLWLIDRLENPPPRNAKFNAALAHYRKEVSGSAAEASSLDESGSFRTRVGGVTEAAQSPPVKAGQTGAPTRTTNKERHMSTDGKGRQRYTMQELLAQCDPNAPRTAEEQEWLDAPPVGREFGGWRCVGISRLHRELRSILQRDESVIITHRGMPVASLSEGRLLTDDDLEPGNARRDTGAEILQAIRELTSVGIKQMNSAVRSRGATAGALSHIKGDPRWSDDESLKDAIDKKRADNTTRDDEDSRR